MPGLAITKLNRKKNNVWFVKLAGIKGDGLCEVVAVGGSSSKSNTWLVGSNNGGDERNLSGDF